MNNLENEQPWTCILPVLAIAVLADKRVRDPELVEFAFEAQAIGAITDPDRILPRQHLRDWFASVRPEYEAELKGPGREEFVSNTLKQVEDPHLRQMLLTSIFGISVCDYELHDEEQAYIHAAMTAWDVDLVKEHAHVEY